MAIRGIERKIRIRPNTAGASPKVVFDPNPLTADSGDQIFWVNEDSQPHWPGRLDGTGNINKTFYMPNQIAPNGDVSSGFSPSVPGPLPYACSLPGHENETGTINVVS